MMEHHFIHMAATTGAVVAHFVLSVDPIFQYISDLWLHLRLWTVGVVLILDG